MPRKSKNASAEEAEDETITDIADIIKISDKKAKPEEKEIEFTLEDLPGIGPAISRKLEDASYRRVEAVAVANVSDLAAAAEIGDSTAQKIIVAARKLLKMGFKTAKEVYNYRLNEVARVTTMSKAFDELLGGGIETGSITEVYGAYRSGKTQIAHQLTVSVQLPPERGGITTDPKKPAVSVYIDTESTFRPERIVSMAKALELDPEKVLENILVAKAYNSDHQMVLVQQLAEQASKYNVKVIVVDSVMSHFRAEYIGRGTLAVRQGKLNRHLHDLQRLADSSNYIIFVTNQVMSRPDAFFGDPTAPVGGHILAHVPQTRLYLRRSKGQNRICRLVDSPSLPEGEAVFQITEDGIRDP